MKDSEFDLVPQILTLLFPDPAFSRKAADDSEFGFDPPAAAVSFPKFLPTSKKYTVSNAGPQREEKTVDPRDVGNAISQENQMPTWTAANESSPQPSSTHSPLGTTSAVFRYGQATPHGSDTLSPGKALKDVEPIPGKVASSRKDCTIQTGGGSPFFLSLASPSRLSLLSSSEAKHHTRKATTCRKKQKSHTEDEKRRRSLEKNKLAAAHCRIKRRQKEDSLQERSRELLAKNIILKGNISNMLDDVRQLQSILKSHLTSGDCSVPANIAEALIGERADDCQIQMDMSDDEGSEAIAKPFQQITVLQTPRRMDTLTKEAYVRASLSPEIASTGLDCLSPGPDFTKDLESTTSGLDDSFWQHWAESVAT